MKQQEQEIKKAIDATSFIKIWVASIMSVVIVVVGAIFWVEDSIKTYGKENFYLKVSGENTEKQIQEIKDDLKVIQSQNFTIIQQLSILQGRLKER